jgi:sugar phosphate isomerase/epimerase
MLYDRRKFIRISGGLTTGLALGSLAGMSLDSCNGSGKKIDSFGLQLYTLRDDMPKDPKGVLKQVASDGYKQIESFEGSQGMFWGMTNTEFKKYMDDLGMTIVSSHCDVTKDFEKKAADAAAIGMKYLIYPYEGEKKTVDDYKNMAADFNAKGEICRKNGMRFAFHNHDMSFLPLSGQYGEDVLIKNTDPSLVDMQMDIYWVVTANQDPEAWFKKYKNRFRLVHVKDRTKNTTERADTCTLGEGSINYSQVLNTAKENGVQYFIVEQEKYAGTTPLKAVEADARYMKDLKLA